MKKLGIDEAFVFSEILDKMKIEADINNILDEGKKKGQAWVGGQIFFLLFKKMYLAKEPLVSFLANVSEKTEEEVHAMGVKELKDIIVEITKDEGFADFFKSALPQEQK